MEKFEFNNQNLEKSKEIISKYPQKRSAILPLLDLAQRQNGGWLSSDCIAYIADIVEISYIRAYEVVTFYTMFNLKPVGKYHIQVCGTTPCCIMGAEEIKEKIKSKLGIDFGETTENKNFTLTEVECLGACVNAPVIQINDDYYECLSEDKINDIIDKLN
jgi:NADH-quinone oxidoreductase subunit E